MEAGLSLIAMRILFITNVIPDQNGGGTPRRAAAHLEALRRLGHVTIVVPPLDGITFPNSNGLSVIERGHSLADARLWKHEGAKSAVKRFFHALRRPNLADGRAWAAEKRHFRRALRQEFDLVFAFRMRSATWWESVFGRASQALRIVDLDDIESTVFSKKLERTSGPWWWRLKLRHELRWLAKTQRRIAREWRAVCLCSKLDAERFRIKTDVTPWIIPNGYKFKPPHSEIIGAPCQLLFVGTFGYFPNAEGVRWFVRNCWPLVLDELGDDVELALVGLYPTPQVEALGASKGVRVLGNVPSVDPYYAQANIIIAPLHAGSGTRIKLIEAAAHRRAIVTTTIGCEGLDFVDHVHAEVADDPKEFALRIVALARDDARRATLAEASWEHAKREFSSEAIASHFSRLVTDLIDSSRKPEQSLEPFAS